MDTHRTSKHSKPEISREITAADPLPPGWEMVTHPETGWPVFVNHDTKSTSFTDPRPAKPVNRPSEIFREQIFQSPSAEQRMRQGMDFFDHPQHPFFNHNQTLNRQRFPTINRRPQSPVHEEWFKRGTGSLSPSQVRRMNIQRQQPSEPPRGFGPQRTPGSPGQSRKIPIMVADGHGGFRSLERDRNLVDERSHASPPQHDIQHLLGRQSSLDRPQPMGTPPHVHHLDRRNSGEGQTTPPRIPPQNLRGVQNNYRNDANGHQEKGFPTEGNRSKTFNIPIQIEGNGRECFVKDDLPSEDEGYSQEDCSSQTEDENKNIAEPEQTPVITHNNYRNVKNMPRFVSEAHFPNLAQRVEMARRDSGGGIHGVINNEENEKFTQNGQAEKSKHLPESECPFPEVAMKTENKDGVAEVPKAKQLVSSGEKSVHPAAGGKNAPEPIVSSDIDEKTPIPMPPPPHPEKEDSAPSGSEKSQDGGSTKGSDSEMESQSVELTPLEKIAKITASITKLGKEVKKFHGSEKTSEYRKTEEYLMRALLALDKIDTQGNVTVRTERKKAVQMAQTCLNQLEKKGTK